MKLIYPSEFKINEKATLFSDDKIEYFELGYKGHGLLVFIKDTPWNSHHNIRFYIKTIGVKRNLRVTHKTIRKYGTNIPRKT